ncbi:MAG: hypothetical protein EA400_07320 [Chromatiaceae bacterium]|nr:MAG: hypothetical protein EA400_07320 [Chromatiaceae bacterium]
MFPRFIPSPRPAAAPVAPVLLVVGAHRDERAFGERVAALLDPARFTVLRIAVGICGARPRADELPAYRRQHAELYRQIAGYIAPAHRLLIDLHAGIHESGRCADVLCADAALLAAVQARLTAPGLTARAGLPVVPPTPVRGVRLVADTALAALPASREQPPEAPAGAPWAIVRPEIPASIWARPVPRYVGLEVYLQAEGAGQQDDWQFARALIETIADCALGGGWPGAEALRNNR